MNASTDPVILPGPRDVRAALDAANERPSADLDADGLDTHTETVVVACPPHPQHGGARSDSRLTAVSAALCERGIDCLRFDYGPWDEGRGERRDVRNACRWATERYDSVGLFGYSFGATTALCAAAEASTEGAPEVPTVVSVLAPDRGDPGTGHDAVAALDRLEAPVQVCHGERDTTVAWEPVVERARERGFTVESLPADHFFVGQSGTVAERVGAFLADHLP